MRILVVTDKLSLDGRSPGCIALNLRDAYKRFCERDCALTICNLRAKDPAAAMLRKAGLPVIETGFASASPRTLAALVRAARETEADLIHAHGYAAANFGRLAALRLGIPVVVHEHAILRIRPHQFFLDLILRRLTTHGVAISNAVARFMVQGRCVPTARLSVIPNGIDLYRFQSAARWSRADVRAFFGWPPDIPIIGSAARFRREKGLHVLFEAVARLRERFPDLLCVMAGDGPERGELQRKASEAGLSGHIVFPGFIDDIPRFMRALTLLSIPSLQEGLSYSAMEAMAVETPVVASRVGGLPELIDDGQTGVLIPPGDPAALAAASERLLGDSALRRTLSERAAATVRVYDLDVYADRMVALFRQLHRNKNSKSK